MPTTVAVKDANGVTQTINTLPALSQATGANSLPVVLPSDQTVQTNQIGTQVTKTDASGTLTAGGTAQTIIAANANRHGFEIQNLSNDYIWFSTLAPAVQSQPSMRIPPGGWYVSDAHGVGTGAVSIIGPTTGQAFSAREW